MTGTKRGGFVLQTRERHFLRELEIMRIVDRVQAKIVVGFGSDSRANRRLRKLTQAGLLKRFFLGTTAAGQKALYSLSEQGAAAVGVPYRSLQRRSDEALVADFFVNHQLAINEFYCGLKYGRPPLDGVALGKWRMFHKPIVPGKRLIPDGYFTLQTPDRTKAAFLEVDLGYERGRVWHGKVKQYLRLATSGDYEQRSGQKSFRVLVITTTERRVESLRRTVADLTKKIFRFTTLDLVRSQGPFASVWLRPTGDDRSALIDNEPEES
jgi:hypothetical protein